MTAVLATTRDDIATYVQAVFLVYTLLIIAYINSIVLTVCSVAILVVLTCGCGGSKPQAKHAKPPPEQLSLPPRA